METVKICNIKKNSLYTKVKYQSQNTFMNVTLLATDLQWDSSVCTIQKKTFEISWYFSPLIIKDVQKNYINLNRPLRLLYIKYRTLNIMSWTDDEVFTVPCKKFGTIFEKKKTIFKNYFSHFRIYFLVKFFFLLNICKNIRLKVVKQKKNEKKKRILTKKVFKNELFETEQACTLSLWGLQQDMVFLLD